MTTKNGAKKRKTREEHPGFLIYTRACECCGQDMEVEVQLVERGPNEVTCHYQDGRKETRIEEMRRGMYVRLDIAIVTVGKKTWWSDPTLGEHPTDWKEYSKFLSKEQKTRIIAENRKLQEIAKTYPEYRKRLELATDRD